MSEVITSCNSAILASARDIPFLKQYDTKIIVNVCGKTKEEYLAVVERLADEPVDMLEINISCPNVKEGGIGSRST